MRACTPPVYAVEDVTVSYGGVSALRGVSAQVHRGIVTGLVGPNGSGKTTLLRTMYGALRPDSGRVLLNGADLSRLKSRDIARQISVVVQNNSAPHRMSVLDEVLLGRLPFVSDFSPYSKEDRFHALDALEAVGMKEYQDRRSDELSGGERQRVVIARALAQDGGCILLDEPTNHLDIRYQHELLRALRGLGKTIIVVLHDLNAAARYCDEIHMLDNGRVHSAGPVDEVLSEESIRRLYEVEVSRVEHLGSPQFLFTAR